MAGTRHTLPAGRVFGIPLELDYSWFLIAGLITWLLAIGYYPAQMHSAPGAGTWVMGAGTAVLFFASIVGHEAAHSWVAMQYRLPVRRITLFVFGGVSEIGAEPPNAAAEFVIAAVGPLTSFALAGLFWLSEAPLAGYAPGLAIARYLAMINGFLGLFNLLPGFPLDGGRVFRALVWGANQDFRRATLIAANTGRIFGFGFVFGGIWMALRGDAGDGLWIAFLGWYLENAAAAQVKQQVYHDLLTGHQVAQAMGHAAAPIPADATLESLVEQQVLDQGRRTFLVDRGGGSAGLLTLHEIRAVPRDRWATTTAADAMIPLSRLHTLDARTDLWTALEKMGRDGINQAPVLDAGRLVGLLSRGDILEYLQFLRQVQPHH